VIWLTPSTWLNMTTWSAAWWRMSRCWR
jgi:hypothetical protein